MTQKTIKEFVIEMKAAFGSDIAIQICLPSGEVLKQTENWIDEEQFLKMEKIKFLEMQKRERVSNGNWRE